MEDFSEMTITRSETLWYVIDPSGVTILELPRHWLADDSYAEPTLALMYAYVVQATADAADVLVGHYEPALEEARFEAHVEGHERGLTTMKDRLDTAIDTYLKKCAWLPRVMLKIHLRQMEWPVVPLKGEARKS